MIQSMTGFGKSVVELSNKKITFQLKSLNSKKLDLYSRLPSEYREKEMDFKKIISEALERGKVDFELSVEKTDGETATKINHKVVKNYMEDLKTLAQSAFLNDTDLLRMAINLPNTFKVEEEEIDEEEFKAVKEGLKKAIDNLQEYRTDEGKALEKDFRLRIQNITDLLDKVGEIDPERIQNTRERLQKAASALKEDVDENRFEQELVYYLEKYDITEEKTRLNNHLSYFLETLESEESNGRKLNFISQEMGREINTIGSKSNHARMQKCVVQMKDELEKIKEQLLNVL